MPFLLLLVVTLTCLQRDWPEPNDVVGSHGSAALTVGYVVLIAASAGGAAWRSRRRLLRNPESRWSVLHHFARFRRWHCYLLMGLFVVLVWFGGWGWLVGNFMVVEGLPLPGIDLVLLAPL